MQLGEKTNQSDQIPESKMLEVVDDLISLGSRQFPSVVKKNHLFTALCLNRTSIGGRWYSDASLTKCFKVRGRNCIVFCPTRLLAARLTGCLS